MFIVLFQATLQFTFKHTQGLSDSSITIGLKYSVFCFHDCISPSFPFLRPRFLNSLSVNLYLSVPSISSFVSVSFFYTLQRHLDVLLFLISMPSSSAASYIPLPSAAYLCVFLLSYLHFISSFCLPLHSLLPLYLFLLPTSSFSHSLLPHYLFLLPSTSFLLTYFLTVQ